jgi:DNA primase large subunit
MLSAPISRFPFLIDDPLNYLRGVEGLHHINSLADLFDYYKDFVEKAIEEVFTGEKKLASNISRTDEIVLTYSLMIPASILNNPSFSTKVAVYLAKRYSPSLLRLNNRELITIANLVGIGLKEANAPHVVFIEEKTVRGKIEPVKKYYSLVLEFYDYLKLSKRLGGEAKYKLTNQVLIDGKVYLALNDRVFISRLIEEKFYEYILNKIDSLMAALSLESLLEKESVLEIIGTIKKIEPKKIERSATTITGPIKYNAFPPCMARIYESLKNGENLSHHQRFAIVAFLGNIGVDKEEIIDMFRGLPDFKEKITRYQVEHILGEKGGGKKYLPYSCEKMKTIGLCVANCNVKNPLQYYIINARKKK